MPRIRPLYFFALLHTGYHLRPDHTVFSSLQFERIYLPDEYAGTPKTEVERLENELANLKAKEQALDAKDSGYLLTRQTSLRDASQVLKSYEANFNVRKYAASPMIRIIRSTFSAAG